MPMTTPVQDIRSQTSLPDSLKNPRDLAIIKKAVTQWSRLVAWSWTAVLAFAGDTEKEEQEKTLKAIFIQILQRQAQSEEAFVSYGIPQSEKDSCQFGEDLKNLILGDNQNVPVLKEKEVTLTLSDVLQKLSGEEYVLTRERDFVKKFTFQVICDRWTGSISQVCDEAGNLQDEYFTLMAYPQKPVLSEATITERQLADWAKNLNTGGRYLPPSVYIPIAMS